MIEFIGTISGNPSQLLDHNARSAFLQGIPDQLQTHPIDLKRHALFFDRIGIVTPMMTIGENLVLEDRFKFLVDTNVIFIPKIDYNHLPNDVIEQTRDDAKTVLVFAKKRLEIIDKFQNGWQNPENLSLQELRDFFRFNEVTDFWFSRLTNLMLNRPLDCEATSINTLTQLHPSTSHHDPHVATTDVIGLVLKQFPVPDETTPWENIVSFKKENRDKLVTLRRWIYEVTRKGMTQKEAAVELQYLTQEYQKAMALYEIKYTRSRIETIVTTTLEMLENIVDVKPSKPVKALFSLKRQKVDLLEAEMKAPGREISYVVEAQKRFRPQVE